MTDSNERGADSSEKSTERYGYIKDSSALGRGSDVLMDKIFQSIGHLWLAPYPLCNTVCLGASLSSADLSHGASKITKNKHECQRRTCQSLCLRSIDPHCQQASRYGSAYGKDSKVNFL